MMYTLLRGSSCPISLSSALYNRSFVKSLTLDAFFGISLLSCDIKVSKYTAYTVFMALESA